MSKSDANQFNAYVDVPCSTAMATASGSHYPNPLAELAPDPIYETRPLQEKEPIVPDTNGVEVMKLLDYDPNTQHIDADRYTEEQKLMHELSIRAEARLASFMDSCRKLRETNPDEWEDEVARFTNNLVDLMFEGRTPLPTTARHTATMKLVFKATLINLVTSHAQRGQQ